MRLTKTKTRVEKRGLDGGRTTVKISRDHSGSGQSVREAARGVCRSPSGRLFDLSRCLTGG